MRNKIKNRFVVINHAADLKIKVTAETLEELFLKALEGMAYLMYRNFEVPVAAQITVPVKVSSLDINSLLTDFLSEVLYQSEAKRAVFFKAKLKRFSNSELEAELAGRAVNKFDRNIKAVTYHNVRILRNPEGLWETEVIFNT